MRKLGRLLTILVVLTLGFGTSLQAFAASAPMKPEVMAGQNHAAMADIDGAGGDCSKCAGEPGAMQDCLPTCMSVPVLFSPHAIRVSLRGAVYDLFAEQAVVGASRRPDPYPPKPIILG